MAYGDEPLPSPLTIESLVDSYYSQWMKLLSQLTGANASHVPNEQTFTHLISTFGSLQRLDAVKEWTKRFEQWKHDKSAQVLSAAPAARVAASTSTATSGPTSRHIRMEITEMLLAANRGDVEACLRAIEKYEFLPLSDGTGTSTLALNDQNASNKMNDAGTVVCRLPSDLLCC
jgi:hypothetical protein